MSDSKKTRIALVVGDPCGIGPELTAKLLADPETVKRADIIVVAGQEVFEDGLRTAGASIAYRLIDNIDTPAADGEKILLLTSPAISRKDYTPGTVSRESGTFQLDCLARGLELCRNGHADAMCFAPLNKEAMHLAGLTHEDEAGFFIERLGHRGDFGLLNTLGTLWTSRATSHVAHRQVSELLNQESIVTATRLLHAALLASGNADPKIAVAGLNPHAGDGGMFGTEEIDIIGPAVRQARAEGIDVAGPFPPDTIFLMGRDGKYDAIVTMYHDQGQIAMKLMGFDRGVTVHAGLPFPITTSAHGSALDIAGQGIASENALRQAFLLACSMAR